MVEGVLIIFTYTGRMQCVENLAASSLGLSSTKGGILILADKGFLIDQPYFRVLVSCRYLENDIL